MSVHLGLPKPPEPPANETTVKGVSVEMKICDECKHCGCFEYVGALCCHPHVEKKPVHICPVSGEKLYKGNANAFPFCSEINKTGDCQMFEKRRWWHFPPRG